MKRFVGNTAMEERARAGTIKHQFIHIHTCRIVGKNDDRDQIALHLQAHSSHHMCEMHVYWAAMRPFQFLSKCWCCIALSTIYA